MTEYAEALGLFGVGQHGFRQKHSTTSNILAHHERLLKQLELGRLVDCIYIDLSRAFDKVSHTLIICKLKKAGFHGRLLAFCSNFLNDRQQMVFAY